VPDTLCVLHRAGGGISTVSAMDGALAEVPLQLRDTAAGRGGAWGALSTSTAVESLWPSPFGLLLQVGAGSLYCTVLLFGASAQVACSCVARLSRCWPEGFKCP
jgi:hypothetical protein